MTKFSCVCVLCCVCNLLSACVLDNLIYAIKYCSHSHNKVAFAVLHSVRINNLIPRQGFKVFACARTKARMVVESMSLTRWTFGRTQSHRVSGPIQCFNFHEHIYTHTHTCVILLFCKICPPFTK